MLVEEEMNMEITWDAEAKAVYIALPCEGKRESVKRIQADRYGNVHLDDNEGHELVGIEILHAMKPVVRDITRK